MLLSATVLPHAGALHDASGRHPCNVSLLLDDASEDSVRMRTDRAWVIEHQIRVAAGQPNGRVKAQDNVHD